MKNVPSKLVHTLRTPEHGADSISFDKADSTLSVNVVMSGGTEAGCKVVFSGAEMFFFRSEPFSVGFPSESYDAVCKLTDSKWVNDFDRRRSHVKELQHFAMYVSNAGFFEVAAQSVEVIYEDAV